MELDLRFCHGGDKQIRSRRLSESHMQARVCLSVSVQRRSERRGEPMSERLDFLVGESAARRHLCGSYPHDSSEGEHVFEFCAGYRGVADNEVREYGRASDK